MGGFQLQKLQMSWQPSLLSQKRKNGPPLGLKNLGNSCYLNSVLQCLTYTPPLANFCLRLQHSSLCDSVANGDRKRDCPFCILEKRIVRSLSLDLTLDAPAKIQSCLKIFAEHFRCGRQEDAHEFLRYVIDACHNTCLRLKKLRRKGIENGGGGGVSVVKEIFGGALQSQVKCLCCNYESNKVDEIMDISLDVLNSYSVRDAMQKFFQPEVLDGNNKYKCEKCQKLVAARKQMSILQAPNVLVIQLKRFEGIFGAKIDKAIAFEEVLVLSSFMSKTSQDPQPEYNLFGTIVHSGYSPESGHYYAYIKDAMGRWYCCNDSYVTLSTLQEVLSEKVYVLFFSRTNQRPASAASSFASYGVKSRESNGCVEFKSSKGAVPLKALPTKPQVEQSSKKDVSAMSRIDRVPSSPPVKSSICGNSGSKSTPLSLNGKVDHLKGQNKGMNGNVKETVHVEKHDKDVSTVTSSNGFEKHKNVDAVEGENCHAFAAASENGHSQNAAFNSVKPLVCDSNGTTSKVTTGRVHDHLELQNGSMKCCADISGLKRKLKEDTSILLAQDAQSLAKIEEFKEALKQQASLILGSCGFFDKVYDFMRARKRLCVHEAGNKPSGTELKKLLIADAKRTFISQIPESLKEDLVKRLQSFSQEKRHSSAVLGNSTVS